MNRKGPTYSGRKNKPLKNITLFTPTTPVPPGMHMNRSSQESAIMYKLEEMAKRMDLIQSSQNLKSLIQNSPQQQSIPFSPRPPHDSADIIYHSPSPPKVVAQNHHRSGNNLTGLRENDAMYGSSDGMIYNHNANLMKQEINELRRVVMILQDNLKVAQDEYVNAVSRAETESKERVNLEQINDGLNIKLSETRNSLKDTQNALFNVQLATEHITVKRQENDSFIRELSAENSAYQMKIAQLEERIKTCEEAATLSTTRRDDFVHKLQSSLNKAQDDLYRMQQELAKSNGEKNIVAGELDATKQRMGILESKYKNSEYAIENNYKSKITSLEDKLESYASKIDDYNNLKDNLSMLEEDNNNKAKQLQLFIQNIKNLEFSLQESSYKLKNMDSLVHEKTAMIQELEFKCKGHERNSLSEKHNSSRIVKLESDMNEKSMQLKSQIQVNNTLQSSLDELNIQLMNAQHGLLEKNSNIQELELKIRSNERDGVSNKQHLQRISSLEDDISEKSAAINMLQSQMSELRISLEESGTKVSNLEILVGEKTRAIADLETKLKLSGKEVESSKQYLNRISQLENALMELNATLESDAKSAKSNSYLVQEQASKIKMLENSLIEKNSLIQQSEIKLQKVERDLEIHKRDMIGLQSQHSNMDQSNVKLNERISSLAVEKHELSVKCDMLEQLVENAAEIALELDASERQLEDVNEEFDKFKNIFKDEHKKYEAMEKEVQRLTSELNVMSERARAAAITSPITTLQVQAQVPSASPNRTPLHEILGFESFSELDPPLQQNASSQRKLEVSSELNKIGVIAEEEDDEGQKSKKKLVKQKSAEVENDAGKSEKLKKQKSKGAGGDGDVENGEKDNTGKLKEQKSKTTDASDLQEANSKKLKKQKSKGAGGDGDVENGEKDNTGKLKEQKSKTINASDLQEAEDINGKKLKKQKSKGAEEQYYEEVSSRTSKGTKNESNSSSGYLKQESQESVNATNLSGLQNSSVEMGKHNKDGRRSSMAVLIDHMASTRKEVEELKLLKHQIKEKINKWNADYTTKNKREPTQTDKENDPAGRELYQEYQVVATKLKKRESKLEKSEQTFQIKKDVMPALKEKGY